MPAPLAFTEAGKTSKVWSRLFDERPLLAAKLSDPSLNITIENHEFGMPPDNFFAADTKYPQLREEFEVLNTAVDRKGVEYVATIEQELADLIYNTKPVFTAREIVMEASYDGPDITYFFDKQVAPHDRDPEVEGEEARNGQQERMTVS